MLSEFATTLFESFNENYKMRLPTYYYLILQFSHHRDTIDVDIIVVVVIVVDVVVGVGYGVEKHDHESEEIETVETEISDTAWTTSAK